MKIYESGFLPLTPHISSRFCARPRPCTTLSPSTEITIAQWVYQSNAAPNEDSVVENYSPKKIQFFFIKYLVYLRLSYQRQSRL